MRRTASTLSVLYLTAVLASGGLLELTMGPEPAAWAK